MSLVIARMRRIEYGHFLLNRLQWRSLMERKALDIKTLRSAVVGRAAALRCVTDYQPAGGVGDKVFPPTYEGGKYAVEKRVVADGELVDCVLLDSVPSQANRMEQALLDAWHEQRIKLPVVSVRFDAERLKKKFVVTSLDAPHRVADAILRDSLLEGVTFRKSTKGRVLDTADVSNATGLFGLNPTALVFGLWDSTGPRGGLGAKFQRALVSEIVGYHAEGGVKTSSRIDPLQIQKAAGPVFRAQDGEAWTLDASLALKKDGKAVLWARTKKGEDVVWDPKKEQEEGKPSKLNHGNIKPSLMDSATNQPLPGGFTISHARQTTVLSLAALRRLRFPDESSSDTKSEVNVAARTVLAALGILGATLAREQGTDLRSRCQLFPTQAFVWELLDAPGEAPQTFTVNGDDAVALFDAAVQEAVRVGLPWSDHIKLTPSEELIQLVARSQDLATHQAEGGE